MSLFGFIFCLIILSNLVEATGDELHEESGECCSIGKFLCNGNDYCNNLSYCVFGHVVSMSEWTY